MNKKEYIEKYGEEAYQRQLECKKRYYQQHKEENRQYREQHREELLQYNKQYKKQHREELLQYNKQYKKQHREELLQYNKQYKKQHREELLQYKKQYYQQHIDETKQYYQQHIEEFKQYRDQHKEEYKQWSRKNRCMFAFCIPEEWEQIENYQFAKKDNFDGWCIHHQLETHNSDGQRRLVNLSREELKALDMYYNRPANELIFLTNSEHTSLHRSKQRCSKE